jgi:hypothetical protein
VTYEDERAKIDETAKYLFTASKNAIVDFISQTFPIIIQKERVEIELLTTEYISHNPGFSRFFPDIVLKITGLSDKDPLIHIEIQTEHDGTMDLRMVKYGYIIGASKTEVNSENVRVIFIPHQVVIYLEENKRISDELTVQVVFPNETKLTTRSRY